MTALVIVLRAVSELVDWLTWPVYFWLSRSSHGADGSSGRVRARQVHASSQAAWRCCEAFDELAVSPDKSVRNLADLLHSAVRRYPDLPCFGTRKLLAEEDEVQSDGRVFKKVSQGEYRWLTYAQTDARVQNFGRGLLSLGLRAGHRLVIFAETRADWQICVQAAFRFGLPAVTLYATLGDDALVFGVEQSETAILVTSSSLAAKVAALLPRMQRVEHVVCMGGMDQITDPRFKSMEDVERMGENRKDAAASVDSSDLALIMYTSGSTGQPKGVMLTHGNLLAMITSASERVPELGRRPNDVYIGYLPLAHVLELACELSCVYVGVPIGYGSPLTLSDVSSKVKPGTKGDLTQLRPTFMAAVPAILDRIAKNVWAKVAEGGPFKRALFEWAFEYKQRWLLRGVSCPLVDAVVFGKVRALLGGRVRAMLSGGAPLSPETQRFMHVCFGVSLTQGYGLTETTGGGTLQQPDDLTVGRVGPPLSCCEVRLRDWKEGGYTLEDAPLPRGEILIGGNNVAAGYFRMPEKTAEDFFVDDQGIRWFCSGDIGSFHEDGTLSVVDRKNDLVKLQNGEFVSPGKVETALGVSGFVEQICVYGDSTKNFVVALVVPKMPKVQQLAAKLGLVSEYGTQLQHQAVRTAVLQDMLACAGRKLQRFEQPTRVHLCSDAWTPDSNLVTDALKLKRKNLQLRFQCEIDSMYAE